MSAPFSPITPTTLPRVPDLAAAEDFDALKRQALNWLPEWCYDRWTNFNENDPGMMILEQLIYAATEMPYRAGLPMDQLLRDKNGHIPWNENSLFAPTKILPTSPLTADDYARLLYDRIPALLYARIEPLAPDAAEIAPGLPGRLSVSLAIDPEADNPAFNDTLANVRNLLSANCNLGERCDRAVRQPFSYFDVQMDVELTAEEDANKVAASLYLSIKKALLPGARFRTLTKALQTETMDDALNGPLLERGVIEDEDLPRLWTWAEARERTAQAVLACIGKKSTQVTFPHEASATPRPQLFLAGPIVTVTALPPPTTPSGKTRRHVIIKFARRPLLMAMAANPQDNADANAMIGMGGENPLVQFSKLLPGQSWAMPPIPDQPATEIGEYRSLQTQFPRCFALGEDAVPADASPQRRARVRQLKGYLLVFEQLIANYFAQLAHTSDYFSNLPQTRTMFTQPLANVPDVLPLLGGYIAPVRSEDSVQNSQAAARFWGDRANPYIDGLHAIAEDPARFATRRGRALDHLLARFNESFPVSEDRATFETIVNKQSLLQAYPALSVRRAQAADHGEPAGLHKPRPRSGLEEKIQLLLRRDTQHPPSALDSATDAVRLRYPDDFYFVLEPIRFLPAPDLSAGAADAATASIPLTAFAPVLFHVFFNWSFAPLTPAFTDYAEALVRDNAPAHLWHRFIWMETRGPSPADVGKFLDLFLGWTRDGFPTLQCAPSPSDSPAPGSSPAADTLTIIAGTSAADLFTWLLGQTAAPAPGISIS